MLPEKIAEIREWTKKYLVLHDRPFRRTHELEGLLYVCVSIDQSFSVLSRAAKTLSRYAVDQRYPSAIGDPTREEAEYAVDLAQEVSGFVFDRLPPDAKPGA